MIPIILTIEDENDRAFIEELYNSYRRLMFSEIRKVLNNESDIEDVQQESLIKLMDKIPLLRTFNRDKTVNYIITTCRNNALNYIRGNKRAAQFSFDEGFDSLIDTVSPGEDRLLRAERREDIRRAWDALDAKSRRVLEMKYVLELPNEAIAREFCVGEPSVRMLLTRARAKLKKQLDYE